MASIRLTSSSTVPRIIILGAALSIAACGGSGGGSASPSSAPAPAQNPSPPSPPGSSPTTTVCGSAFLGNATVQFSSANCSNSLCSNTGAPNAIDNDRDTAAVMSFSGPSGTSMLTATTQPGVVVPAGKMAGALISFGSQTAVSTRLTFNTYLNDTLQESGGGFDNVLSPSTNTTPNFYRFANGKPYNRIDVVVEQSGSVTTQIFEMCSE